MKIDLNYLKEKKKILIPAIIILIVSLLAIVYISLSLNLKKLQIIDFKDKTKIDVMQWVEINRKYAKQIEVIDEYSEDVKEGFVISQSIKNGDYLDKNQKLIIKISKGFDPNLEFDLPTELLKSSKLIIEKWFSERHFKNIEYKYESNDKVEKNFVISLSKTGKIKRSDKIIVRVSDGNTSNNDEVVLPDFTKFSYRNMLIWLENNDLELNRSFIEQSGKKRYEIISQKPEAGSKVKKGSTVSVKLAEGTIYHLKSLVGLNVDEVKKYLADYNLEVEYISEFNDARKGSVFKINPNQSRFFEGDELSIYISKGSNKISLSSFDFIAKSESDLLNFIDKLNKEHNYNLKVTKANSEYSNTINKNLIIKHSKPNIIGDIINYTLSLGNFKNEISADSFNSKTINQINSELTDYRFKNSGIAANVKYVSGEKNAAKVNTSYDCNYREDVLECKFYQDVDKSYTLENFNSNPCGEANVCVYEAKNNDNYNLRLNIIITEVESELAKGTIVSMSPNAGSVVHDNETINLSISKGPRAKLNFDLTTMILIANENLAKPDDSYEKRLESYNINKNKIISTLNNLGFTNINVSSKESSAHLPGSIISEDSSSSGEYNYNDEIKVVISIGV